MGLEAAERARRYYDETHALYVRHVGYTCQAGLIHGLDSDPYRSTVLYALEECRLPDSAHILDAGAGACGPSAYICEAMENASVVAVTISPVQASCGRELVARRGLADKVDVMVGDYHSLPHADHTFDAVLFLESAGHSDDQRHLFGEMFRVTKPGGKIYVKDVFRREGVLTAGQREELDRFNRVYAYSTRSIGECADAITQAGFEGPTVKLLPHASTAVFREAMWERDGARSTLSAFGASSLQTQFAVADRIRADTRGEAGGMTARDLRAHGIHRRQCVFEALGRHSRRVLPLPGILHRQMS